MRGFLYRLKDHILTDVAKVRTGDLHALRECFFTLADPYTGIIVLRKKGKNEREFGQMGGI